MNEAAVRLLVARAFRRRQQPSLLSGRMAMTTDPSSTQGAGWEPYLRDEVAPDGAEGYWVDSMDDVLSTDKSFLLRQTTATKYALEKFSNARKTGIWDYGYGELQTIQIPSWSFEHTQE